MAPAARRCHEEKTSGLEDPTYKMQKRSHAYFLNSASNMPFSFAAVAS